jgi:threonine/homoserine/homoserine lactone efflux protein
MLATFVVTTWLLAMLPGVGQALMLRQTLTHGRAAALATIAGTSTGLVLWSLAAAGGLSAVLLTNDVAYSVLRWSGGLFLAYVGVRSLLAGRDHQTSDVASDQEVETSSRPGHAFAAGLATNLGNPKAGVFAISLLPQFAPSTGNVFLTTACLGVVWALVTSAWYVLFVSLVQRCRTLVTRPAAQRLLNRTTGAVLLTLGVGVVLGL